MSEIDPFLSVEGSCEAAVAWVIRQGSSSGLRIVRTFDLQVARQAHTDCPCPHHGTDLCDCQMVVLLVYGDARQPITLVAHCYEGKTRFSLVDTPQQRADPRLEAALRQALTPQSVPRFDPVNTPHAT
jgi:hypothetical protein